MTQVLVATRSRGKQAEFRRLLGAHGIDAVFPDQLGLHESPGEDAVEAFDTFVANARAKAEWFARLTPLATLADDSGLEVDALHGAPGVRSRRFAGQTGPDHVVADANVDALLAMLASVPDPQRTARYRTALVLLMPASDGTRAEVRAAGTVEGVITYERRGAHGFGYDPIFLSTELGITFGEASDAQKETVSHRARAVEELIRQIGSICS